jgi:16S rRNA (uracil1498-N3)-methyltransferase
VSARRFFVSGIYAAGDTVTFDSADARKIATVLRLRTGDRVEAIDSAATLFDACVAVDGHLVTARLESVRARRADTAAAIDLAQGVPKGQKMDFVVEKATELGARAILPVVTQRSVVRESGASKVERWRRLARAAAQQSGRRDVPSVEEPQAFADVLGRFPAYDLVLFPWEAAETAPLRERLPGLVRDARSILLLIGPEGGFSHAEAEDAERAGARIVSLGRRILRSETAGLAVLSILSYEMT